MWNPPPTRSVQLYSAFLTLFPQPPPLPLWSFAFPTFFSMPSSLLFVRRVSLAFVKFFFLSFFWFSLFIFFFPQISRPFFPPPLFFFLCPSAWYIPFLLCLQFDPFCFLCSSPHFIVCPSIYSLSSSLLGPLAVLFSPSSSMALAFHSPGISSFVLPLSIIVPFFQHVST